MQHLLHGWFLDETISHLKLNCKHSALRLYQMTYFILISHIFVVGLLLWFDCFHESLLQCCDSSPLRVRAFSMLYFWPRPIIKYKWDTFVEFIFRKCHSFWKSFWIDLLVSFPYAVRKTRWVNQTVSSTLSLLYSSLRLSSPLHLLSFTFSTNMWI